MYAIKNIAYEIGPPCYQSGVTTRQFNNIRFSSNHVGGTHFLMVDGAVNFVSENIDFATYTAAATREGEEDRQLTN